MKPSTFIIADRFPLMRLGLRNALQRAGHHVLAEVSDGREIPDLVKRRRPDVLVTEIDLEGWDGLEAIRRVAEQLGRRRPSTLVLSARRSEDLLLRAFAVGADGFALKTATEEGLLEAIAKIHGGDRYVSPEMTTPYVMSRIASDEVSDPLAGVTPREREVLRLVAEGKTNKQIASLLGVAVKTVEAHRANMMRKLGLHDLSSVIRFAIRLGLLPPDGGSGV